MAGNELETALEAAESRELMEAAGFGLVNAIYMAVRVGAADIDSLKDPATTGTPTVTLTVDDSVLAMIADRVPRYDNAKIGLICDAKARVIKAAFRISARAKDAEDSLARAEELNSALDDLAKLAGLYR